MRSYFAPLKKQWSVTGNSTTASWRLLSQPAVEYIKDKKKKPCRRHGHVVSGYISFSSRKWNINGHALNFEKISEN